MARTVGIGAVKYADLSNDREKDYLFAWDRMLAMDGNTAVYLQYANTRIQSILRKATVTPGADTQVLLNEPAERALALRLAQFPAAVQSTVETYSPHKLTTYLYDTASSLTAFYESCPVLKAEPDVQASRLLLITLASRVLTKGLELLGIGAPARM
ncbi:hypothetical protein GCM10029964_042100 [Kibdelosporangium lantanae]